MIDNHVIQADLITDLKAATAITDLLANGSADQVKEAQYQGTQFAYPGIRVSVDRQIPDDLSEQCDHTKLTFSIFCFTESGSSLASDQLAGVVKNRLHKRYFVGTGWRSWFRCVGLVSAMRIPNNLWRAQVMIQGNVYPTVAQPTWHSP